MRERKEKRNEEMRTQKEGKEERSERIARKDEENYGKRGDTGIDREELRGGMKE